MSAKGSLMALDNMTKNLQRNTLPRLPPLPGFHGHQEYMQQVELWKKWIAWEKDDPLVLRDDEPEAYKMRVLYCYKQALMALRFWPEMWVDAAEWCFQVNMVQEGVELGIGFLAQGVKANPESILLALKQADRVEETHSPGESDDAKIARGKAVREPLDKLLTTLYDMYEALKQREASQVEAMEARAKEKSPANPQAEDDDDDAKSATSEEAHQPNPLELQIAAVKQSFAVQKDLLNKTISFAWIAMARAMRRIQGKGSPTQLMGGLRQVFTEARRRGKLSSDAYVEVALMESTVYKDPVGAKIFERGAQLFSDDESFMIEYLKFLHAKDDITSEWMQSVMNRLSWAVG